MKVTVKFLTAVRNITGKSREELMLEEGSMVEDLLQKLSEKYGSRFKEYVYDEKTKNPRGYMQFLIDGRNVAILNGMKTKLYNGCQVAIVPPMRGG